MAYYNGAGNEEPPSMGHDSEFSTEWSPDLDPDDLQELRAAQQDPTKIISELPREAVRMGYYSTICLIFNRMIGMSQYTPPVRAELIYTLLTGVGIFNSASAVFTNTQSIGLSLILWMIGSIICLAGLFVFVELGLTIPRWPFGHSGEKISALRSGDGLNYVSI